MDIETFVANWEASGASERANKDLFLVDLCEALGVERPNKTTGDAKQDTYVFERDAPISHADGAVTVRKIDLYKAGCFILEAKQGSDQGAKKLGTAKRGTPGWHQAMRDARGQASGYANSFETSVPFLIVCDIGYCFDLYACFDGSRRYEPFPNNQKSRLYFKDFAQHRELLAKLFTDPLSLDPSKHAAKVTRELALFLADLAKTLEKQGHGQELIAEFLMRCLFTMFAEDTGLLAERALTKALREYWIPNPASFPGGIESLWKTMNTGGSLFGVNAPILRFNGGLFANPTALPLNELDLRLLLAAAEADWSDVEPAIFGTLLERALDPKERHKLGAHFTPRAYVERLVRPTIEEPLRADWEIVQAQVRQLVNESEGAKSDKKLKDAIAVTRAFHQKLCKTRVLDPACGTGNFLYVALDLFKRLESEVVALLESLGETQTSLHMGTIRVTPEQFLGIEIKPWAREIAELVLWIGYLQWHFRSYGKSFPVPEPVLTDYHNIECRDAVLAYDAEVLVRDEHGKPITRWDGETTKKSPITGEQIPDDTAQIPLYEYENPRKAEWPQADFIIGNPPFIGNKRMRDALGDGYVEALRKTYDDVPESADLVMYWWHRAALSVRAGTSQRFGLITTNSIAHSQGRIVTESHMKATPAIAIRFAVADHPWVESDSGAAVRIAMTVADVGAGDGCLLTVEREVAGADGVADVELLGRYGVIHADLSIGASVGDAQGLRANEGLSFMGVTLVGDGFRLTPDELKSIGLEPGALPDVVRPYRSGKEVSQVPQPRYVIDAFGLSEDELREQHPALYQRLLDRVRPLRAGNNRASYRDRWWVFAEPRAAMREALAGLPRYVATLETSKHRFFVSVDGNTLCDHSLFVIASDDWRVHGILSSRVHVVWAMVAGSRLGVGNDSRWRNKRCFDPFPFPVGTEFANARVRKCGEELDRHRKERQALHPELTITGMYNVLEKLRAGEALSAKEKVIHEQGLVSVLKQLHDDLDRAVFDAYEWPRDLSDEQILEKLVALNRERAEEERRGLVRWLRPEFQNPSGKSEATQTSIDDDADTDGETAAPVAATATPWPKKLPDQISAIRDLTTRGSSDWTVDQVAASFKGAKKKDVEDVLDSLSALGLLVTFETNGNRQWRNARG